MLNNRPVGALPPPLPVAVELRGKYIALAPLMTADDSAFAELFSCSHGDSQREAIWRFLPYGTFANAAEMADFYRCSGVGGDPQFYIARHLSENKAAGIVSYLRMTPESYSIEIGHIWHAVAHHRGRANTESAFLLIKNAFALGYRRLEWKCDAMNMRSRLAALRLGLAFEGIFRQCTVSEGKNRDTAWFALLDKDWPVVRDNMRQWLEAPLGAGSLTEKNRPLVAWSLPAHECWTME